jgi:hypothetical protein
MNKPSLASSGVLTSTRFTNRLSGGTIPVAPRSLSKGVLPDVIRDLANSAMETCDAENSADARKEQDILNR